MNLCIVNEDHPQCNVPKKAIKACQGRGRSLSWALSSPLALSYLESGHAILFSPQDFCSPCVFVYCSHNTGSCGPGSVSLPPLSSVGAGPVTCVWVHISGPPLSHRSRHLMLWHFHTVTDRQSVLSIEILRIKNPPFCSLSRLFWPFLCEVLIHVDNYFWSNKRTLLGSYLKHKWIRETRHNNSKGSNL